MAPSRSYLTGDVRRQQILEVGTALFIERGFESVKMQDIAQRLDVSRPYIYTYYPAPEAIFEAALSERVTAFLADLDQHLQANPTSTATDTFRLLLQHRELVLLLQSAGHSLLAGQRRRFMTIIEEHTRRYLGSAIPEGQEKPFYAVNHLQIHLMMSVAAAVLNSPERFDVETVGGLMHTMMNAGYGAAVPEVLADWHKSASES